MSHSILERLQKTGQKEDSNDMYSALLSDVKTFANTFQKAESDVALSKAAAEASDLKVAAAQSEVGKVESERETMKNLYETAKIENNDYKGTITKLQDKVTQLKAVIHLEQESALMKIEEYKVLLNTETEKRPSLEKEIANLKGKLSTSPKQVKVSKPSPIPSFTIDNVMRGANDRIVSATITPVRLN